MDQPHIHTFTRTRHRRCAGAGARYMLAEGDGVLFVVFMGTKHVRDWLADANALQVRGRTRESCGAEGWETSTQPRDVFIQNQWHSKSSQAGATTRRDASVLGGVASVLTKRPLGPQSVQTSTRRSDGKALRLSTKGLDKRVVVETQIQVCVSTVHPHIAFLPYVATDACSVVIAWI